jgi:hypothetical protein
MRLLKTVVCLTVVACVCVGVGVSSVLVCVLVHALPIWPSMRNRRQPSPVHPPLSLPCFTRTYGDCVSRLSSDCLPSRPNMEIDLRHFPLRICFLLKDCGLEARAWATLIFFTYTCTDGGREKKFYELQERRSKSIRHLRQRFLFLTDSWS